MERSVFNNNHLPLGKSEGFWKTISGSSLNKNLLVLICAVFLTNPSSAQNATDSSSKILQTKTGPISIERLASLSQPWGMSFLPDGRLLVTEKPGTLRIFSKGTLSAPVAGVPKVVFHEQGGLLDVEVDPNFATNSLIYLSYAEAAAKQPDVKTDKPDPRLGDGQNLTHTVLKGGAVARGRLEGTAIKDLKVIWRQEPKQIGRGHFGGKLVFAPDGMLFITSGDRQRFEPAQDSTSTLGKIIRINPDGAIPKDNPYVNNRSVRPDIRSSGHRNQLGAAIHPTTNKLWIHEMGPAHGDELNIAEAGKNYGWPVVSNGSHYNLSKIPDHDSNPNFAAPVYHWHPAISPSGMIFYTGTLFPKWQGNLLIGGLSSETLVRLNLEGTNVTGEERLQINKRIRDVIQAPDGSVWVLTDYKEGELLRLSAGSVSKAVK